MYFQLYPKNISALVWRYESMVCSENVLSSKATWLINGDFKDVYKSLQVLGFFFFFSFLFFVVAGLVPADPLLFMLKLASSGFTPALGNTLFSLLDSRYRLPVSGHCSLLHRTALVGSLSVCITLFKSFSFPFPISITASSLKKYQVYVRIYIKKLLSSVFKDHASSF